jgi:hypothetical protein
MPELNKRGEKINIEQRHNKRKDFIVFEFLDSELIKLIWNEQLYKTLHSAL